jgi:hypothetical protein
MVVQKGDDHDDFETILLKQGFQANGFMCDKLVNSLGGLADISLFNSSSFYSGKFLPPNK